MLRILTLFLLVNCSGNIYTQNTDSIRSQNYYREVLDTIEKHSIVSDSIDWIKLRKEVEFLTSSHYNDTGSIILKRIFNELRLHKDYHSFWRSRKRQKELDNRRDSFNYPKLDLINGSIGHLTIPSFGRTSELDQYLFIDSALRQIERMDNASLINGWIIDLRNNTGGSMYPMIACVLPLIEEDSLGYFVNKKEKLSWLSILQNPKRPEQRVKKYKCRKLGQKIAVLIDSKTASAAEMTAISLIGKPNLKLLGQSSRGLTTANRRFRLSNGSILVLAVSWCLDSQGKIYYEKLVPEMITKEEETLEKAIEWIAH